MDDLIQRTLQVPFHRHLGIEVIAASAGQARVRAPDTPELKNPFGTMHGGMLFALGEICAAFGIHTLLVEEMARLRAVTRSAQIAYLKPARGAITAASHVQRTHDEILHALEQARAVDVPIGVTLADERELMVATMQLELYVSRARV